MIGSGRRVALRLLQFPPLNHALRLLACARGHALVLVYHQVASPAQEVAQIVPSVPVELFRAQLQALGEVIDLVSVDEILPTVHGRGGLAAGPGSRPRVALTFDDDLPSHVAEALPILQELRVPATFFLSGRALHGLGPYWFQRLEALLATYGEGRTAELLGVDALQRGRLARLCERDRALQQRVAELETKAPSPPILEPDGIAALARAGMTIGFHTVDHGLMLDLDDETLNTTVSHGRTELSALTGTAVRHFAYPHGKVDNRASSAVRAARFEAAFTGDPKPLRPGDDCYRLGRWEPGPLEVDDLLVNLTVRLHRTAPQLPLVS